jgi:flagella basal body P-ring formation protein FlgA
MARSVKRLLLELEIALSSLLTIGRPHRAVRMAILSSNTRARPAALAVTPLGASGRKLPAPGAGTCRIAGKSCRAADIQLVARQGRLCSSPGNERTAPCRPSRIEDRNQAVAELECPKPDGPPEQTPAPALCRTLLACRLAQQRCRRADHPWPTALDDYLRVQTPGLAGQGDLTASAQLDRHAGRTRAAPSSRSCLSGSRLWGKTTVGIRCLGPTPWTVYVPVQIRIAGNYLVAARQLAPGQVVAAADLLPQSGDLGALPAGVLTDPAQAIGKTVTPGRRCRPAAAQRSAQRSLGGAAGQSVKLLSSGAGFTVSNEGKALNNAAEGQVAQVRTASGQVVSGIARRAASSR